MSIHLVRKRQDSIDLDLLPMTDLLDKAEVYINLTDSSGNKLTIQRSHVNALIADGWVHTDLIPATNIVEDGG